MHPSFPIGNMINSKGAIGNQIGSGFRGKGVSEEPIQTFKVVRTKAVEEILELFTHIRVKQENVPYQEYEKEGLDKDYQRIAKLVRGKNYTSEDVTQFVLGLNPESRDRYFDLKLGLFLSALINEGKDSDYMLYFLGERAPMGCWGADIGYKNTKNIFIRGNVGSGLGRRMISGKIEVDGDCLVCAGLEMSGGKIIVRGHGGEAVGNLS